MNILKFTKDKKYNIYKYDFSFIFEIDKYFSNFSI